ncbi:uncharacterized protein LOC109727011 [Ananas comosus]|uniref:Uncharacterized protein LOC109727011 n=2 Tax=Ananas comosus TaxID=4615 RepID=A0A199V1K5_ANACO|nr:uncharacterized protein LOC109727011 [Ananas comosus]OAY70962.1 hypothetical protein ACMD2_17630 [Ananas comosus]CAD1830605.1 unnamed protein product [Ananas comosus var. bracteatus]
MITRSNLAEQLREYQIRSKHEWATLSYFASTASSSSRVDVVLVLWELLMFAFFVFSGVALYFRYMRVAFFLVCVTAVILVCMKIAKKVRQNRRSKRRMLLPLSM